MAPDYVILSGLVLSAAALTVANGWQSEPVAWRRLLLIVAVVVGCTVIFDPILVQLQLIDYDYSRTLGWKFFGAPVEDLAYALVAATLIPYLWERSKR